MISFFYKDMFRSSRIILTINGIILFIIGLSDIIFAKKITIYIFPITISNPEALEIGIILRYTLGSSMMFLGIILYKSRIAVKSGAQRILLGCSFGFFIMFCSGLFVFLTYDLNVLWISLIVFPLMSILSFYVSTRTGQE